MEYSKLVAVTGLPGLYELMNSKTDGAIVRSLDDKSTKFVSSRVHNFSHLESIEVYTTGENVNLVDVFNAMTKAGGSLPDDKDSAAVKKYFEKVFPDKLAPKTVVIIPSITMDQEILSKISGITFYEERLLSMLMLLRMPATHVVYVTSMPVDPVIIDYYLHLLPGITGHHAQKRLHLLSCYDNSSRSLTEKILERPLLIEELS